MRVDGGAGSAGAGAARRVMRRHVTISVGGALFFAALLSACGSHKAATTATTPTTRQNGCIVVSAPKMAPKKQKKPNVELPPNKIYDVTMATNCGSFTIRMDQKQSPNAASSFVTLVQRGFFNETVFHRIVPGFVIQGGDPTGTGTGGPGYSTVDKPPKNASYTHGVVAMAKTATEPAGTAGSQFFIVTVANAGLPPDYAIIGKVVKGLAIVDHIGTLGDASQQPTQVVEIRQATVKVH
jgi:cyclophilin family peptidyl-prolyl cis-trans isomerase